MFKNVNLQKALEKERQSLQEKGALNLTYKVFDILNDEVYREREIRRRVFSPIPGKAKFTSKLDESRVYNLEEIRSICIKYRLRFLQASKFKKELPYEAILKIKRLEKKLGEELSSFYIVAPSEAFQLEDCDKDPLLFIALEDGRFYFVHQWGRDMHWSRKWLVLPTRSFVSLGLTILIISLLLALLVPTRFIENSVTGEAAIARLAFFIWSLIGISSMVTYVGLAFFKNVSSQEWNNPFFKQHF